MLEILAFAYTELREVMSHMIKKDTLGLI